MISHCAHMACKKKKLVKQIHGELSSLSVGCGHYIASSSLRLLVRSRSSAKAVFADRAMSAGDLHWTCSPGDYSLFTNTVHYRKHAYYLVLAWRVQSLPSPLFIASSYFSS